jgi:hypothetical protein
LTGYSVLVKKSLLAMFVIAAMVMGLLAVLLVGLLTVKEDGGSQGAPALLVHSPSRSSSSPV